MKKRSKWYEVIYTECGYQSTYYLTTTATKSLTCALTWALTWALTCAQETTATCYIEEREWRQRWLSWTSLFNLVHTEVNIQFADEMGNRRGSWKGGTIGVYAPMTKEERTNADI